MIALDLHMKGYDAIPILLRIEQEVTPHVLNFMNNMEESTYAIYEMMWRRVLMSFDDIVEVNSRDLKVSTARRDYPLAFII